MYYLCDIAKFARKKGSKDKTKRRLKNFAKTSLNIGASLGVGLAAGKAGLKASKRFTKNTRKQDMAGVASMLAGSYGTSVAVDRVLNRDRYRKK